MAPNYIQETSQTLFGIPISDRQALELQLYEENLMQWNRRMNLTAIRTPEAIQVRHFLDSLSCLLAMQKTPMKRVIDIGTGAGFPGLVLKIARPEIKLTLVEATSKKLEFCRQLAVTLGLEGVEFLPDRAEAVGRDSAHRGAYDWAVARGVARMPVLAEYLLPLIRIGGYGLAQKGKAGFDEAEAATGVIEHLGGKLHEPVMVDLPGIPDTRTLIVIEKVAETPSRYPRRVGIPAKRPLTY